jgi:hypothetical protein
MGEDAMAVAGDAPFPRCSEYGEGSNRVRTRILEAG